jgi:uncharacterized membrane protein (UPF0136 family)
MLKLTGIAALLYAAVSLVGGIQGYAVKGSVPSIVAGVAAGILLGGGGWLALQGRAWAAIVVGVVSLALVGRFLPGFLRTHGIWPALVMAALGVATLALSVAALLARRPA